MGDKEFSECEMYVHHCPQLAHAQEEIADITRSFAEACGEVQRILAEKEVMFDKIAELEARANLHDGMFDAVEAMFDGAILEMTNYPDDRIDPLWQAYKLLLDTIESGEEAKAARDRQEANTQNDEYRKNPQGFGRM